MQASVIGHQVMVHSKDSTQMIMLDEAHCISGHKMAVLSKSPGVEGPSEASIERDANFEHNRRSVQHPILS